MLRTAGVVFRTHGMEQGEVMMHIYMPGEVFGKAFQVEAVGITEGILVALFHFDDPLYDGLCGIIGIGVTGVIVVFPIGLAADAKIE